MQRIRLLAALQTLSMPDTTHHELARDVVADILDLDLTDLPTHNPRPEKSLEAYLANWLGLELT